MSTFIQNLLSCAEESPNSLAATLLKHGHRGTSAELPKKYRQMAGQQCFNNAKKLARRYHLNYVEGYAAHDELKYEDQKNFGSAFIHHGWCETIDGVVIDPTWKSPATSIYFGITIPKELLHHGKNWHVLLTDIGMLNTEVLNALPEVRT